MNRVELINRKWCWPVLLLLLFLVALLFRFNYLNQTVLDHPIRADARQYIAYGMNLYFSGIYSNQWPGSGVPLRPDSFRSPGLPLLIAACIYLGGENYYKLLLYSLAIMGALLVVVTYGVGRSFLSPPLAWGGALLVAFSPHLIAIGCNTLTEVPFALFLVLSLWLFLRASEHGSSRFLWAVAALCTGFAYLINETFLFVPFIMAGLTLLFYRADKRYLAMFLSIFLLFPVIWKARDWVDHIPPERSGAARAIGTLSHGAYPDFIYKDPRMRGYAYREDPEQPVFGSSLENFVEVLSRRAAEDPWRYLRWYLIGKPVTLWSWDNVAGQDIYIYPVIRSYYQISPAAEGTRVAMKIMHPWLVGAAWGGVLLLIWYFYRREFDDRWFAPALVATSALLYFTILYSVFAPYPRYAIPLRPELYLMAIWAVSMLFQRLQNCVLRGRTI